MVRFNSRKFTILAQDPSVTIGGKLVLAQVDLPYEDLAPGPVGYRVKVVDFDASADVLYRPYKPQFGEDGIPVDQYAPPKDADLATHQAWQAGLLADPMFHAQNAYAIVMRTLGRFEFALGRRIAWGFEGHQLHVAPHAFREANAYYSEDDKALFFGYFDSVRTGARVYTCLSHDIVAHETTHALLDGIRDGFTTPSTPDQAAFHEGFADVVALLSVFSLPEAVELALTGGHPWQSTQHGIRLILTGDVSYDRIIGSMLLGVGKELGAALDDEGVRADALRRSVRIVPERGLLAREQYQEPHARGEVFAAAMLRSFVSLWCRRIEALGTFMDQYYNLDAVMEEGSRAAANLLTMAIRALDYCPPIDLSYSAYLSALLTADTEMTPDDTRFHYRATLVATFGSFGIDPAALRTDPATGCWQGFRGDGDIVYHRSHSASMLHDKEEVFRFIWENRRALKIDERGYLRVCSVRASVRQGADGFFLRETICEYLQVAKLFGSETRTQLGFERPAGMSSKEAITAYGGGTIVFDQFGRIKYHIEHRLDDAARQSARLEYLWKNGQLGAAADKRNQFAHIHSSRAAC